MRDLPISGYARVVARGAVRVKARGLAVIAVAAIATLGQSGPTATGASAATAGDVETARFADVMGMSYPAAAGYVALTPAVDALDGRARAELGPAFAGVWRAKGEGGVVHLAFTRDDGGALARAVGGFPRPDLLRPRLVPTSLADLSALTARIATDIQAWRGSGIEIVLVGPHLPTDTVLVRVFGTEKSAAAAQRRLREHYRTSRLDVVGATSRPQTGACVNDRDHCGADMQGGIRLNGPSGGCTSGLEALQGATPVLITAGHCFALGEAVTHGPRGGQPQVPVGTVSQRMWSDGANFDSALIPHPTWLPSNFVYYDNNNMNYQINSVAGRGAAEAVVGDQICHAGVTTGLHCGMVDTVGASVPFSGGGSTETINNVTQTCACGEPGDSGGPFVYNNTAFGVYTGQWGTCTSGSPYTFYVPIKQTEDAWGVSVLTAPPAP